jgi:hypothetical protein
MGSRLTFKGPPFKKNWDPDDQAGMLLWAGLPAPVKVQLFESAADVMSDSRPEGNPGLPDAFYGDMIRSLNDLAGVSAMGVGYDWRNANEVSGVKVADKVIKIADAANADKVIMITHSMGGLVTRAAIANNASLAARVFGVIHIVQPVLGAVNMYMNLTRGPQAPWPIGFNIAGLISSIATDQILGPTAPQFAALSSALPGPLQLLPSNPYKLSPSPTVVLPQAPVPLLTGTIPAVSGFDHWLQVYDNNVRRAIPSNIYNAYRGTTLPGVLHNRADLPALELVLFAGRRWTDMMTRLSGHLTTAETFHGKLDTFEHPNTRVVSSDGLGDTLVGSIARIDTTTPIAMTTIGHFLDVGDRTVPLVSQQALAPNATTASSAVAHTEHGDACKDAFVNRFVRRAVIQMVVEHAFQQLQKSP